MPNPIDRRADAWLAFASAAISGHVPADDIDDDEEFLQDVVENACAVADAMTVEFSQRFLSTNGKGPGRRRGRGRAPTVVNGLEEEETE